MKNIRQINAGGIKLPVLGQGGWTLGDNPLRESDEIKAVRYGISLGLNMIDTAEMYGDGASETLIGKAISGIPRDDIIVISKVFPYNSGRDKIYEHCAATLSRLGLDYLDMYLLHWRGEISLEETVENMEELVKTGLIRRWGVSNFDTSDMEDLWGVNNGDRCAVNQVMYNIGSRGIEYDLLPWCRNHGVGIMAYEPLMQAGALKRMHPDVIHDEMLEEIARERNVTVQQIMLAFVLRQDGVCAIPQSVSRSHILQNAEASEMELTEYEMKKIDGVFWPPSTKMHLDID